YNILFAGTISSDSYTKSYWLASPGVGVMSDARFGPGFVNGGMVLLGGTIDLFSSGGYWRAYGYAVRPVVVLKSNINVNQLQVIEDQTEETWSTKGGQTYGSGSIGA